MLPVATTEIGIYGNFNLHIRCVALAVSALELVTASKYTTGQGNIAATRSGLESR